MPALSYGDILPRLMMTFTIFSTFWVFAPLISLAALVYFAVACCVYRYLLLFCHMPRFESGGEFFFLVFDRVLFGVLVSNVILFFWLLTRGPRAERKKRRGGGRADGSFVAGGACSATRSSSSRCH